MSRITELKMQKNKTRVNLYLDGEFACGMELFAVVKNGLKVGSEITKDQLVSLQEESDKAIVFEKALNLVERQLYTKKQLKTKLLSKGYSEVAITSAIKRLEEYNYINDEKFASSYLNSVNGKSKKEIEVLLKAKGISDDVIISTLDEYDGIEEKECRRLVDKYMRYKDQSEDNKKKLFAFLYRKGFPVELINTEINNFFNGEF